MANLLHTFLRAGNVQARPIVGTLFDYGNQSGLTGTFSQADEKLQMELVGYIDEIDLILVADVTIFNPGNLPATKATMTYLGGTYTVRSLKTDESAYVLGLKKVSE